MQAARTEFRSGDTATQVTGACSSSVNARPVRQSKRRTVPSTLPATISALRLGAAGGHRARKAATLLPGPPQPQ
jgi:hypothetical protein